jgi:hypothetical protein
MRFEEVPLHFLRLTYRWFLNGTEEILDALTLAKVVKVLKITTEAN